MRAIGQALVLTPTTANDAAAGLSNMLHNLGGAVGTASLGTIMTKREQYHSNIISQPVAHGISDPSVVTQRAIVTLGRAVRRQALSSDSATPSPSSVWSSPSLQSPCC